MKSKRILLAGCAFLSLLVLYGLFLSVRYFNASSAHDTEYDSFNFTFESLDTASANGANDKYIDGVDPRADNRHGGNAVRQDSRWDMAPEDYGNASHEQVEHYSTVVDQDCFEGPFDADISGKPDIAEGLSENFNYGVRTTDDAMQSRAMAGDGVAQEISGKRLHGQIVSKLVLNSINSDTPVNRYRWKQKFKLAKNFFILSIRNRSKLAALELIHLLHTYPFSDDRMPAAAWANIHALMSGEMEPLKVNPAVLALSAEEKRASWDLAIKYIDIYDLGFLAYSEEYRQQRTPHDNGIETDVYNYISACAPRLLSVVDASLGPKDGDQAITQAPLFNNPRNIDPLQLASERINSYERLLDTSARFQKESSAILERRFSEIKLLLIESLKNGDMSALVPLVKIHLEYETEYDPIEAAAWSLVGEIKGLDPLYPMEGADLNGLSKNEFVNITEQLFDQYLLIYQLL